MRPEGEEGVVRVAVLDDYQAVAASYADWNGLTADVTFFPDHLADHRALIDRLVGFEVIVAMREKRCFIRVSLMARISGRLA